MFGAYEIKYKELMEWRLYHLSQVDYPTGPCLNILTQGYSLLRDNRERQLLRPTWGHANNREVGNGKISKGPGGLQNINPHRSS